MENELVTIFMNIVFSGDIARVLFYLLCYSARANRYIDPYMYIYKSAFAGSPAQHRRISSLRGSFSILLGFQ